MGQLCLCDGLSAWSGTRGGRNGESGFDERSVFYRRAHSGWIQRRPRGGGAGRSAHLELVGICVGTSTKKVRRVLPDRFLPTGSVVTEKMLEHLYVAEEEELEFGLVFAVGINSIRTFLLQSRSELLEKGIDVRESSYMKMWGF